MALTPSPQTPAKPAAPAKDAKGAAPAPDAGVPRVSGFRIRAERRTDLSDLFNRLSVLQFMEFAEDKDSLVAINVENRDIQKNPYLFSITYFRPGSVEVIYTCVPGMSPKKRRLEMLKYFMNILTVISPCYAFDISQLFQLIEHTAGELSEYVSSDYEKLFAAYDTLKTDVASLQAKAAMFSESNSKLSRQNHELKEKNDELSLKLRSLEVFSDEVLILRIQEWLSEHKGEINVTEFSRVHSVPEMRIEQMLNRMVTEGYIEASR